MPTAIRLPYICLMLLLLSEHFWPSLSEETCALVKPTDHKLMLLKELSILNGQKFIATSGTYSYAVSFCSESAKGIQVNASVTRLNSKTSAMTVLGRYNETDINGEDNWRLITYAHGDNITEDSHCNNTRWKSLILLTCPADSDDFHFELLDPLNAGCFALFHLKTHIVCPPQRGYSIFFLILIIAIACYFIIGMAYRRFVTGAKGIEQIPHYNFWRNPCAWFEDLMARRDTRSNEPWSGSSGHTTHHNDSADEPLLHP